MRRLHRWLSVLFGLLILWIGATGLLSQAGALVNDGGFKAEARERGARQATAAAQAVIPAARAHEHEEPLVKPTPAFACPADMNCRPKRVAKPGEWNLGLLHRLHSGEQFGPAGVLLSMASALALLFFAFSGLWMYIQMYRRRAHRHHHPKRLFW